MNDSSISEAAKAASETALSQYHSDRKGGNYNGRLILVGKGENRQLKYVPQNVVGRAMNLLRSNTAIENFCKQHRLHLEKETKEPHGKEASRLFTLKAAGVDTQLRKEMTRTGTKNAEALSGIQPALSLSEVSAIVSSLSEAERKRLFVESLGLASQPLAGHMLAIMHEELGDEGMLSLLHEKDANGKTAFDRTSHHNRVQVEEKERELLEAIVNEYNRDKKSNLTAKLWKLPNPLSNIEAKNLFLWAAKCGRTGCLLAFIRRIPPTEEGSLRSLKRVLEQAFTANQLALLPQEVKSALQIA